MLRIGLFLLTNLAVVLVASVTLKLLGIDGYMTQNGLDFKALLVFCFVFGMLGAFVSLLLSKFTAKHATKTRVIDTPQNSTEAFLVSAVQELAQSARIGMPEVGIFPADQANAFATGWNRNKALVAISSGMLERYSQSEIKAVMAHEISHVANGDMITLTLIQGVINTFVMFFARVIGSFVDKAVFKNENSHGLGYVVVTLVAEVVLGILASVVVMWFSRRREFAADAGSARLTNSPAMIAALVHLQQEYEMPNEMPSSLNAFGISAGKEGGWKSLFMSHPPLEKRIAALNNFAG